VSGGDWSRMSRTRSLTVLRSQAERWIPKVIPSLPGTALKRGPQAARLRPRLSPG